MKNSSLLLLTVLAYFTVSNVWACDLAKKRGIKPSATQSSSQSPDEPLFPQANSQHQHQMQQQMMSKIGQQQRDTIMQQMQNRRGHSFAQNQ